MNSTVQAAIDAELALLTSKGGVQDLVLGYGRDLSCVLDCDAALSTVDPLTRTAIGQALIRRLITPRGGLAGAPNYGTNIKGYLNKGTTQVELRALEKKIREECLKDERVADTEAVVKYGSDFRSMTVSIKVTPYDYRVQAFNFVFTLTSDNAITII